MHLGKQELAARRVLLLVSVLSFPLFYWLFYHLVIVKDCNSDISLHAQAIVDMIDGKIGFQPNFLFYEIVYLFSGFSSKFADLVQASVILVALAKAATIYTCGLFFLTLVPNKSSYPNMLGVLAVAVFFLLSFQLLHSISYKIWMPRYIGQFTPSLWHNSTTIFLIPFATLLFLYTYKQLEHYSVKRLWIIGILALLNCFIKPTFFIALAPVYGLLILAGKHSVKEKIMSLVPFAVAVLVVGVMTVAIYVFNIGSQFKGESSVAIKPFFTWLYFLNNRWILLPVSLFLSLVFPLGISAYFYFFRKEYSRLIIYTALTFSSALLIFVLLQEVGPRMLHGNFAWQVHVATHIWFVIGMAMLYKLWHEGKRTVFFAFLGFYFLHLFSGILYLEYYFRSCSYI